MDQAASGAKLTPWWDPRVLVGRPNLSLLDSLLPKATFWQRLAVALLFVGLLVAVGRARFYLPDNPVPITLTTFGVLLTGGVLGWRWGLFTVLVWYFLGMAGVPVFQGGGNGWAYVSGTTSATGGFLIGFILSAGLLGYLSQRGWTHSRTIWPMLLAALLLYLPGLLFWYWAPINDTLPDAYQLTSNSIFLKGMYPFIPGDLVKLMAASVVTGALWTVADRRRHS